MWQIVLFDVVCLCPMCGHTLPGLEILGRGPVTLTCCLRSGVASIASARTDPTCWQKHQVSLTTANGC